MAVELTGVFHLNDRNCEGGGKRDRVEFVVSEYEGDHAREGSSITFSVKVVRQELRYASPKPAFYAYLDIQNGFKVEDQLPPISQWWGSKNSPSDAPFTVGSADTPGAAVAKLVDNLKRVIAALEAKPRSDTPADIPGVLSVPEDLPDSPES